MKKLAAITTVLVPFSPAPLLVGIGMIFSPGVSASCTTTSVSGTRGVGPLSDPLEVTTADRQIFTLKTAQFTHTTTIIQTGFQIRGATRDGLQIALMSTLMKLNLRILINTSACIDSGNYPHDGDASDHDSPDLFQIRPRAGWGAAPNLMDPTYQARAFFGGPTGPNRPSPRDLLNIPNWQTLTEGEAAQVTEVSVYPDRYRIMSLSPTASLRMPRYPASMAG